MEFRFVYITTGSQAEARKIGTALVEERLAACVNIIPGMWFIYRWESKIEGAGLPSFLAERLQFGR